RRRHTRLQGDWSSDVCSSDLSPGGSVKLTSQQEAALEMIRKQVLSPNGATGVQECINSAFFKLLNMIVVYPVEDPERWTDHSGRSEERRVGKEGRCRWWLELE